MTEALETVRSIFDPDRALQAVVGSLIRARSVRHALHFGQNTWHPGRPLKLLLAGYVGNRNTGADVRVEEMIRQFRHILGDENIDLTLMTIDKTLSAGYFRTVRQIRLPEIFPKFLFEECPRHHGVVACEGSMFKSKFANALSTMMAGALGMAAAENKLSVGYGAEAGHMDPGLRRFVRRHCKNSLVICRNEPSREILGKLGIRTKSGADTAWTFEPFPLSRGAQYLRDAGWDGTTKILALAPINPFWWPVKPSLWKSAARKLTGEFQEEHYKSIYFHQYGEESRRKYQTYIRAIAEAVNTFRKEQKVFPVLIAMERLDRKACQDLAARLDASAPVFASDDYDMYELVSVLRNVSWLVSSRYHAVVTSMPGQIPSAGITMDERLRNLLEDRGHRRLLLEVTDEHLEDRLLEILRILSREGGKIAEEVGRAIPKQLQLMGQMGIDFVDELARVYPEFPRRDVPRSWEHHLPPLPLTVRRILETYA